MRKASDEVVVSGVGIVSAIASGWQPFSSALLRGEHQFSTLRRPGRRAPAADQNLAANGRVVPGALIGAEIADDFKPPPLGIERELRTASLSSRVALAVLHEAWQQAELAGVPSERIGLIVGGSNFQQRELELTHSRYRGRESYLRPTYALMFMDTDLCGLCSQAFGIHGFAYTAGGASASGQLAALLAAEAVESGRVDVCIALGALMDLSFWECQGLRSLGAMGSSRFAETPAQACRPFDRLRDGFIFGEACGAAVFERRGAAEQRLSHAPLARVSGWAQFVDGNRNPNASLHGEKKAVELALQRAQLRPTDIDYVNPHGSGSPLGDDTEVECLTQCGLSQAFVNTTKSITGHALSAAGIVELIAVIAQMHEQQLHPTRNLIEPINSSINWVGEQAIAHRIDNALNISIGFGGINTALCVQRC